MSDPTRSIFSLANEFGERRKELVASNVDAQNLVIGAGTGDVYPLSTARLRIQPVIVTGAAQVLLQESTGAELDIPAGSIITLFAASVVAGAVIDPNFSCQLGFRSSLIIKGSSSTPNRPSATLAARVTGTSNPLTGILLNARERVHYDCKLNAVAAAAMDAIITAEAAFSPATTAPATINYANLTNTSINGAYVSEPTDLTPCITITAGSVDMSTLVFVLSWYPPILS